MLPSRMRVARAHLMRYGQMQQKRDLLIIVPLAIGVGVSAFVGITFYQVWKKRQMQELQEAENQAAQAEVAAESKTEEANMGQTKSGNDS